MGREFHTLEDFRTELNTAVEMSIENYVVDGIKEAIQESEDARVYSYPPLFESRRRREGGIQDIKNMMVHPDFGSLEEKTIEVEIDVAWQWLNNGLRYKGGPNPSMDLVEAIESSKMYHAPPRPFMNEAETTYGASKFSADLMRGLNELGFDD